MRKTAAQYKKCIEYVFFSTDEYEAASKELNEIDSKHVPGSMKLHAVFPKEGKLYTRNLSCYCHACLAGEPCGHRNIISPIGNTVNEQESEVNREIVLERTKRAAPEVESFQANTVTQTKKIRYDDKVLKERYARSEMPKVNSYILVEYGKKIYPGKVLEVDEHESRMLEYLIWRLRVKGHLNC